LAEHALPVFEQRGISGVIGPMRFSTVVTTLRRDLWIGRIGWDSKHLICRGAELSAASWSSDAVRPHNGDVCASAEQRLSKGST
jgi:hypothetical protein